MEFAYLFIFSDLPNICRLCCKHFPSVFPALSSAMIQLGDGRMDLAPGSEGGSDMGFKSSIRT